MSKVRFSKRQKQNEYTQLSNAMFEDERITYKAKGLLGYMMSRPEGWQFQLTDLINRSADGRIAVQAALKELEENRYLHRRQYYCTEKHRFDGVEWVCDDAPFDRPADWKPISKAEKQSDRKNAINEPKSEENLSDGKPVQQETCPTENMPDISKKDFSNKDFSNKDLEPVSKKDKAATISKIETFDSIIDNAYGAEPSEIKNVLIEFIKMRKLIKKPLTNRALTNIIAKLFKYTEYTDEQVKILDQSITNSWQDVYELKQDKRGNNANKPTVTDLASRYIEQQFQVSGVGF